MDSRLRGNDKVGEILFRDTNDYPFSSLFSEILVFFLIYAILDFQFFNRFRENQMHFKTSLTAITLFAMPLISYASLEIYNYTDKDSSVRITSGSIHPCSSDKGVYTPKRSSDGTPGHSATTDMQIKGLCVTSQNNVCSADIYTSNNCTGDKIGNATLSLVTKAVINLTRYDNRYEFEILNNGTLLKVRYAP